MIHLILNPYTSDRKERQLELDHCMRENEKLFHLDVISDLSIVRGDRLTFGQLFERCKPGRVNVIANADIFFDRTIALANEIQAGEAYALSRWDVQKFDIHGKPISTLFNRRDSQDVWIIRGAASPVLAEIDYTMGVPGCDNRLCHDLQAAGYVVTNPSIRIRAHHYHLTQYRTYEHTKTKPVPPPYAFVHPS